MGTENTTASADTSTTPQQVNTWGNAAQFAGVVAQSIGAYSKTSGENAAYVYQSKVAANNAKLAEAQAQDAIQRGQITEQGVLQRGAQIKGTQAASFAARGISLGEGSALNVTTDTDLMTQRDANTVQANAIREAFGFRTQGLNYSSNAALLEARSKATSPAMSGISTLLTGGGKVASSWYAGMKTGLNKDEEST